LGRDRNYYHDAKEQRALKETRIPYLFLVNLMTSCSILNNSVLHERKAVEIAAGFLKRSRQEYFVTPKLKIQYMLKERLGLQ